MLHCAELDSLLPNSEVPGSIPGGVTGDFFVVPPTEPCALRSTQPLKVSTRDFSWGKGGRCFWLTTYHTYSAETLRKSGALIYPEPLGPPHPVAGDLYFYFYFRTVQHTHTNKDLLYCISSHITTELTTSMYFNWLF